MSQESVPADAMIKALIGEYADAAILHRTSSREGNYKAANRAYKCIASAFKKLRAAGNSGDDALLSLLDDSRIEVRGWAAAQVLEFAPQQAVAVLDEIAAGPASLEELSAKMVLQQWHSKVSWSL